MKYIYQLSFILVLTSAMLISSCKNEKKLPVYGKGTIPSFRFLNQDSVYVTNDTFKDKIYIADFFFTSCSSICPIMHRNLKTVFDRFKDNPEVSFLSHSIDFKYDKPAVLKKYAQKLGVYGNKWQFVCGPKDSIYTIAEKNYLVAVIQDSTSKEGYVHQGWLVLIDKDKRIRGAYDGTDPKAVAQLTKDIPVLLDEYKK